MKLTRVGVDLAKQVFQVHGVDRAERPVWCKRLQRCRWIAELERAAEPGAEIGMEACGSAHYWARVLQGKGYRVKLIAPQFVKPYVKTNKTDANDAQAICEAMSRPSMRYVTVKSVEQQDLQAVHRVRSSLIRERTAKANQLRGIGPLTASALYALVGDARQYRNGRDGGVTRADAAPAQLRRQGAAARDQQARRQVRAHAADPRGALGATSRHTRPIGSVDGSWRWPSDRTRTWRRPLSPTRWRGSPGQRCAMERTMNRRAWWPETVRPD